MEFIIRMKTGFFEKTPYRLEAIGKGLSLIPVTSESSERIVFKQEDILSVTLTQRRHPELEIQTRGVVYSGAFEDGYSFEAVASYLKENLNVKITCEYKGGE